MVFQALRGRPRCRTTLLAIIGFVIGIPMAVGGGWLAWVGGVWRYFVLGVTLLVAGGFLMANRVVGAWMFLATSLLAIAWGLKVAALSGVGLASWLAIWGILALWTLLLLPSLSDAPAALGKQSTRERFYWLIAAVSGVYFVGVLWVAAFPAAVDSNENHQDDAGAESVDPIEILSTSGLRQRSCARGKLVNGGRSRHGEQQRLSVNVLSASRACRSSRVVMRTASGPDILSRAFRRDTVTCAPAPDAQGTGVKHYAIPFVKGTFNRPTKGNITWPWKHRLA